MFKKEGLLVRYKLPAAFMLVLLLFYMAGCSTLPEADTESEIPDDETETIEIEETADVADPEADQEMTWNPPVLLVAYAQRGNLMLSVGYNAPFPLTEGADDSSPVISPNGEQILFRRQLPAGPAEQPRFELWLVDAEGTETRPLVTLDDLQGEMGYTIGSDDEILLDRLPYQIN